MNRLQILRFSCAISCLGVIAGARADSLSLTAIPFSQVPLSASAPVVAVALCDEASGLWEKLDKLNADKEYAEQQLKSFKDQLRALDEKIAQYTAITGPGSDITFLSVTADLDLPGKLAKLAALKEKGMQDYALENEVRLLKNLQTAFDKLLTPTNAQGFKDLKAKYTALEKERRNLIAVLAMCSDAISLIDKEMNGIYDLLSLKGCSQVEIADPAVKDL